MKTEKIMVKRLYIQHQYSDTIITAVILHVNSNRHLAAVHIQYEKVLTGHPDNPCSGYDTIAVHNPKIRGFQFYFQTLSTPMILNIHIQFFCNLNAPSHTQPYTDLSRMTTVEQKQQKKK